VAVKGREANVVAGLVRQDIGLAVTGGTDGITASAVNGNANEVLGGLAGIAGRFECFP
jgi:hypothetical protein